MLDLAGPQPLLTTKTEQIRPSIHTPGHTAATVAARGGRRYAAAPRYFLGAVPALPAEPLRRVLKNSELDGSSTITSDFLLNEAL